MKTLITALLLTIASLFVNTATAETTKTDVYKVDEISYTNLVFQYLIGVEQTAVFGTRRGKDGELIGTVYYSNNDARALSALLFTNNMREKVDALSRYSAAVSSEGCVLFGFYSDAKVDVEKVELVVVPPILFDRDMFIVNEYKKGSCDYTTKETVIINGEVFSVSTPVAEIDDVLQKR